MSTGFVNTTSAPTLGGMRFAEVARAVGFANQSHLSMRFKQLTGKRPAQWLREIRGAPGARGR